MKIPKWFAWRNNPPTFFDKIVSRTTYIIIGISIAMFTLILYPNSIINTTNEIWVTNNTNIHNLALNLTKDCNDMVLGDFCKCSSINRWIYDNIEYDNDKISIWDNSPQTTLKTRIGVCRHDAILACSMLESIDVPCTINTNHRIQNNINDAHAWFEVRTMIGNNEFMIICDPTRSSVCSQTTMKTYINDYGDPIQ